MSGKAAIVYRTLESELAEPGDREQMLHDEEVVYLLDRATTPPVAAGTTGPR